jgi:hypothetical protein
MEILDQQSLPPSSMILVGSASHLFRVGPSCYAKDWIELINKIGQKFRNIHICTLVPVFLSDCPGSLARDIEILATWLHKVYSNTILGLLESWSALVAHIHGNSSGATPLHFDEIVKISLPNSLSSSNAHPTFFKFNSSCPALIYKMDCKTTTELIRIISQTLQHDFSLVISPEVILPRAINISADPKDIKTLVCIGLSIMQQIVPFL